MSTLARVQQGLSFATKGYWSPITKVGAEILESSEAQIYRGIVAGGTSILLRYVVCLERSGPHRAYVAFKAPEES